MKFYLYILIFLMTGSAVAAEQQVSIKDGNVYKNNQQITYSNKDRAPELSPDGKTIAFIREDTVKIPDECLAVDDNSHSYADQIWIYSIDKKKERLLVSPHFSCNNPEEMITKVSQLQFSPDSKIIYFQTPAWVTSGALHSVDMDGTHQHFILPSETFEVVPKGEYKGHLIVQQHRYFIGGGSYDWFWLYTPQGKEDGPLGSEITESQREYLESE